MDAQHTPAWPDDLRVYAIALKLPRQFARMLHALCTQRAVAPAQLIEIFGSAGNAKAIMCKLRAKLAPHGVEIDSMRGVGYWIRTPSKQRLAGLLGEYTGEPDTHPDFQPKEVESPAE